MEREEMRVALWEYYKTVTRVFQSLSILDVATDMGAEGDFLATVTQDMETGLALLATTEARWGSYAPSAEDEWGDTVARLNHMAGCARARAKGWGDIPTRRCISCGYATSSLFPHTPHPLPPYDGGTQALRAEVSLTLLDIQEQLSLLKTTAVSETVIPQQLLGQLATHVGELSSQWMDLAMLNPDTTNAVDMYLARRTFAVTTETHADLLLLQWGYVAPEKRETFLNHLLGRISRFLADME